MKLKETTYKAYSGIAKYCRTGDSKHIKDLELRQDRMPHYRRLVFNITKNTLKQAYPITFKLFNNAQWEEVVDDYFKNHNAQEYRIWLMPKEFYEYLVEKKYAEKYNMPFLNDLLLFEWIEIEVHTMEDEIFPKFKKEGDIWNDILILMPEYRLLQLEYPVHIKQTKEITAADKGNYFLFSYRTLENKSVKFMDLSILFAFCIEQIEEGNTLKDIVKQFFTLTNSEFNNEIKEKTESFIKGLIQKEVVLGFK
ncbi:MAG: DNA-binding domain-containing protein [Chitinophagales bacterium]